MKWSGLLLVVLGLFLIPAVSYAADGVRGVGIVKGAISMGGKPVSDTVVSVEGIQVKGFVARGSKAAVSQREVKFIPRVLAVQAGTTVDFPNHDKVWHNVFSTSEAKKFDLGLYPPGKSRSVTFDKAGIVRLLCNVHPSMEAYIVVKEHPYFAVPDARGNYQLNQVPLGKYRLEVWHPESGTKTVSFELVRDGEVLAINVDLKAKR